MPVGFHVVLNKIIVSKSRWGLVCWVRIILICFVDMKVTNYYKTSSPRRVKKVLAPSFWKLIRLRSAINLKSLNWQWTLHRFKATYPGHFLWSSFCQNSLQTTALAYLSCAFDLASHDFVIFSKLQTVFIISRRHIREIKNHRHNISFRGVNMCICRINLVIKSTWMEILYLSFLLHVSSIYTRSENLST